METNEELLAFSATKDALIIAWSKRDAAREDYYATEGASNLAYYAEMHNYNAARDAYNDARNAYYKSINKQFLTTNL